MKKILNSAFVILVFCSCQKEITQKQISTADQSNNEISDNDIITFLNTPGRLIGLSDYNDRRTTCDFRAFTIQSDADSAFPKRVTLKLIKSKTVKIKSIKIFLDGNELSTRDAATAPIINDTVMFN